MAMPTVFIIDDNQYNITMFGDALEMARYQVYGATGGLMALNWLETHNAPMLILLDMNLPEYDGKQIYQIIRMKDKFVNTIVIIATANKYMAEQMESIIHEGDKILLKPLNLIELQQIATQLRRNVEQSQND